MDASYGGRQVVKMDLHPRRSVLVRSRAPGCLNRFEELLPLAPSSVSRHVVDQRVGMRVFRVQV